MFFRRVCRSRKANLPDSTEPINILIQPRDCILETRRRGLPQSNSYQRSQIHKCHDTGIIFFKLSWLLSSSHNEETGLSSHPHGCIESPYKRWTWLKSQSVILCDFLNRQYSNKFYYSLLPTVTGMQKGKGNWSTFAAALIQHSAITAIHPSLHFLRPDPLLYWNFQGNLLKVTSHPRNRDWLVIPTTLATKG